MPDGHLPVHRWYLARERGADDAAPVPPRDGLRLIRARPPSIEFYRFLYHTVGADYLWADRRRLDDATLLAGVSAPHIAVTVLYDSGTPAGFFELDAADPETTRLCYFGLLPSFVGRGLGRYLLGCTIAAAPGSRLLVDTCSLDHERALANYQQCGFRVYKEEDGIYPDPRLDGTIPAAAAARAPRAG